MYEKYMSQVFFFSINTLELIFDLKIFHSSAYEMNVNDIIDIMYVIKLINEQKAV